LSDNGDDVFTRLSSVIDDWGTHIAQSHAEIALQIDVARGHLDRLLVSGAEAALAVPDANALGAENVRLTAELERLAAEIDAERRGFLEASAALQNEIARLSAEREQLAAGRDAALAEAGAERAAEALQASQRLVELEDALTRARDTIADRDAAIVELEGDQDSLTTALESLAAERDSARAEASATREDGARARAEIEEALALARGELAAGAETNTALREELDAANEEIENLAEQLREARAVSASGDSDTRAGDLQAALDLLQVEYAGARDEIRALKEALDSSRPGGSGIDAFDARGHKKRMGEILVEMGVVTEVQLKSLLKEQAADPQRRLGTLVVEHGYTGEDLVARILAAQLRLPYEDLEQIEPEPGAIEKVSPHVVRLHGCMPLQEEDGVLTVAMVNPLDLIAIEDLELASRCRVTPVVSTRSQIGALIEAHYPDPA